MSLKHGRVRAHVSLIDLVLRILTGVCLWALGVAVLMTVAEFCRGRL